MRNRAPGKAVQPPTVDGISRAKSLTSLISSPDIKVKSKSFFFRYLTISFLIHISLYIANQKAV